jgi:hypothetical protein
MFIDGKIYKVFRMEDLNSLVSFEKWIRDNTDLYKEDQVISPEHFKVFIEYLKSQTNDVKLVSKKEWLKQLELLFVRLEKEDE